MPGRAMVRLDVTPRLGYRYAVAKTTEWVELAAYARAHGIQERTLRRRLKALHAQQGGVLMPNGPPGTTVRKWWFNPAALAAPAPMASDQARVLLADAHRRLDVLEAQTTRLRDELQQTRRRLPK